MKKFAILFLICLFLFTGCEKKKQEPQISFSEEYYKVFEPFKENAGENYVVDSTTRYDLMEVDKVLMNLSLSYFPANNSLYQSGQYLTKKWLQQLLSRDKLNNSEPIEIENKQISHNYISYLYEQDYLSSNGNLKGMSIAIGLNPYVPYETSKKTIAYWEIPREQLLQYGNQAANQLLAELRTVPELKDIRLVIGLFVQASPDSTDLGSFTSIGVSTQTTINLSPLMYREYYLTNNYVMSTDLETYNSYTTLENTLKTEFTDLAIMGKGIYVENKIKNITIEVNTIPKSRGELMAINQRIAERLSTTFAGEVTIRVYVRFNKDLQSMILKEKNSTQANIYIMEG